METDSEKVYMQNLEGFIFDENKIVTYKWLSSHLSLHINVARKLISNFLTEQIKKNRDINFNKTFYVSGILKDGKGLISSVVNENDLNSFKENLDTIISEHIYSIHKSSTQTGSNAIFLAEDQPEYNIGAIKNDSIAKRTFKELSSLRANAYPRQIKTVKLENNKSASSPALFSDSKAPVIKKEVECANAQNVPEKNINSVSNHKPIGKKNNGIAGFFSKQVSKPQEKNETLKSTAPLKKEKSVEKENQHSSENNLKQNASQENNSPKKQIKTEIKSPVKASRNNQRVTVVNKSKAKKTSSKREASKKRKRIQMLDSDSDEEKKSEDEIFAPDSPEAAKSPLVSEDEDIIPPTPEVKPSLSKAALNSRKRKKLVDKTYMDDSGYIITKKEEVYESCSDNEEEVEKKSPIDNEIKSPTNNKLKSPSDNKVVSKIKSGESNKKQSSPTKSKKKNVQNGQSKQQSLMMNFFTKANK